MTTRLRLHALAAAVVLAAIAVAAGANPGAQAPLALDSARITISGTSNIHAYTASTSTIRVTRAALGAVAGPDFWASALEPGAVEAFDVAIPAATLTSPREGLDKNMRKALKVETHADITFRLARLEPAEGGAVKAFGTLRVAGVERDVTLDLKTHATGTTMAVTGQTQLLMTDYGIKPPTAMLGMLKTDPKVTISFEAVLRVPLT